MSTFGGNPHAPVLLTASLVGSLAAALTPAPAAPQIVHHPNRRSADAMRKAADTIRGLRLENDALRAENAELAAEITRLQDALSAARRGR